MKLFSAVKHDSFNVFTFILGQIKAGTLIPHSLSYVHNVHIYVEIARRILILYLLQPCWLRSSSIRCKYAWMFLAFTTSWSRSVISLSLRSFFPAPTPTASTRTPALRNGLDVCFMPLAPLDCTPSVSIIAILYTSCLASGKT